MIRELQVDRGQMALEDAAAARWLFGFRQSPEFHNPSIANFWFWHTERILEQVRVVRASSPGGGRIIVDFGCGDGLLADRIVREFSDAHLTAIDIKPSDIEFIRTAARHLGQEDRLQPLLGNLYATPIPAASADLAICSEVVEHLTDDLAAFHEIHRVLRPEGALILATPNPDNLLSLAARTARRLIGRAHDRSRPEQNGDHQGLDADIHGHINEHGPIYWQSQLGRAGFRVEAIAPVTTRYGGMELSRSPAAFGASLLLQALAAHLPFGYYLSCGVVIRARKR